MFQKKYLMVAVYSLVKLLSFGFANYFWSVFAYLETKTKHKQTLDDYFSEVIILYSIAARVFLVFLP